MKQLGVFLGVAMATQAWGTDVYFNNPDPYTVAPQPTQNTSKLRLQARKVDPNDPFVIIGVDYRRTGGVQEFRHYASSPSAITTMPVNGPTATTTSPTLSVARSSFGFSMSAYHDAASSARLDFELPVNSLSSADKSVAGGAEFGGLSVALEAAYNSLLRGQVWVNSFSSPKLKLYDRHTELGLGFYLMTQDLNKNISANVSFGPEFGFSTSGHEASEQYGSFWGGRAQIQGIVPMAHVRWSLEALLRRLNSHQVAGVAEGGAGLFTWTPRLEYDLGEGIWVGMLVEIPLFRPVGRETAFGNLSLPGVFGKSVGLSLRAATL